jgi:hypothetical protein
VKGILASIDQWILRLRHKLRNEIVEIKKDHYKELYLRIQGKQIRYTNRQDVGGSHAV